MFLIRSYRMEFVAVYLGKVYSTEYMCVRVVVSAAGILFPSRPLRKMRSLCCARKPACLRRLIMGSGGWLAGLAERMHWLDGLG